MRAFSGTLRRISGGATAVVSSSFVDPLTATAVDAILVDDRNGVELIFSFD